MKGRPFCIFQWCMCIGTSMYIKLCTIRNLLSQSVQRPFNLLMLNLMLVSLRSSTRMEAVCILNILRLVMQLQPLFSTYTDGQRASEADAYLISGQSPSTLQTVAQARTCREQSIHRAELSTLVCICSSLSEAIVCSDALDKAMRLQRDGHIANEIDNKDLVQQLKLSIRDTHCFRLKSNHMFTLVQSNVPLNVTRHLATCVQMKRQGLRVVSFLWNGQGLSTTNNSSCNSLGTIFAVFSLYICCFTRLELQLRIDGRHRKTHTIRQCLRKPLSRFNNSWLGGLRKFRWVMIRYSYLSHWRRIFLLGLNGRKNFQVGYRN